MGFARVQFHTAARAEWVHSNKALTTDGKAVSRLFSAITLLDAVCSIHGSHTLVCLDQLASYTPESREAAAVKSAGQRVGLDGDSEKLDLL